MQILTEVIRHRNDTEQTTDRCDDKSQDLAWYYWQKKQFPKWAIHFKMNHTMQSSYYHQILPIKTEIRWQYLPQTQNIGTCSSTNWKRLKCFTIACCKDSY